jgi:four helix bundle protein
MRRASSSIGANLAEGCGRWGDGDMGRFIQIAMGSASELHNLLLLASDLSYIEYIEQTEKAKLLGDILEVRRMLTALFKRVRRVPIVK